jgi:hypothetical protein
MHPAVVIISPMTPSHHDPFSAVFIANLPNLVPGI